MKRLNEETLIKYNTIYNINITTMMLIVPKIADRIYFK